MIASREYVKDLISKVIKKSIHKDGRYLYSGDNKIGILTDFTIYVSSSGNDTTGDGSSTSPYRQISKAISMIPINMTAHTVTINVAAGSYDAFTVNNRRNGLIYFNFSGTPTITGATLFNYCDSIGMTGSVNFTYATHRTTTWIGALTFSNVKDAIYWSGTMTLTGVRNTSSNTTNSRGLDCRDNTRFAGNYSDGYLKLVNCEQGLCAEQNSIVYSNTITGSNCTTTICAQGGGVVRCSTYSGNVATSYGGQIYNKT